MIAETTSSAPPPSRRRRVWRVARLVAVGAVCLAAAAFLARWWTLRSEAAFDAHLRVADRDELAKTIRAHPWNPEVYYWLGVRLTEAGHHKEAVDVLARSVALNPRSAPSRAALGLALARTDQPQEAEAQLKEAIRLAPRQPFAYFTLANLYGRYRRWQQAAVALEKVRALEPGNLEARYLLAQCYGELFQEDLKMAELERLVKEAPDNVRYLKSLGYVYLFFGKFAQAEALYRHVIAIAPQDLETHYLLGRALAEQAQSAEAFAEAEKRLRAVAAKVPQNPGVHLALGILHFRRGEPALAVSELEGAVKRGITENKTYLYLGQAYARTGRAADAQRTLALFQRGAETNRTVTHLENRLLNLPEDTDTQRREKSVLRLRLARVYVADKNYARAVPHLRLVLEQDKNDVAAQNLLRLCEAKARQAAQTTKSRTPKSGEVLRP